MPEAARKSRQQAAATTTTTTKTTTKTTTTTTTKTTKGTPEKTEDGEGPAGDLPGYVPTREDRRIKEVYGYWVKSNDGAHLSGGVKANQEWKARWRMLVEMPARQYDALSGRVGRRFVQALAAEIT